MTTVHVAYDELCLLCVRSVRVLKALDRTRRLTFHESTRLRKEVVGRLPALAGADLDDAMWAVDARGRAYRGFYAFRRIARAVPALWPLVPLLHLPGVPWLGERAYAGVARNRSRLGCRVDPPDA